MPGKIKTDKTSDELKTILHSIAQITHEAIIAINSSGIIIFWDEIASNIFGFSADEVIGKDITIIIPKPKHFYKTYDEIEITGQASRENEKKVWKKFELTGVKKNDTELLLELIMTKWLLHGKEYFSLIVKDAIENMHLPSTIIPKIQIQENKVHTEEDEKLKTNLIKQYEKYKGLNSLFKRVERAKNEWEAAMDCIDSMVLLATTNEGKIKRCNDTFRKFTGKTYLELIGRNLQDILSEHEMETSDSKMPGGSGTELLHKPTGNYFKLNSYPLMICNEAAGNVIIISNITEMKQVTEELEQKNSTLEQNKLKLDNALKELSSLIQKVTQQQSFDVRFEKPKIEKCKDALTQDGKNCTYFKTPEYCEKHNRTCDEPAMLNTDPIIFQIGERFNDMMRILESENIKLQEAYKELQSTQAKILHQEKMASIGQLAAGIAHEINNPVGFVSSNLKTLGKYVNKFVEFIGEVSELTEATKDNESFASLNEKRKHLKLDYLIEDVFELIEESIDGVDRVKTIVQNLKSFSRVDEVALKHADINECLENTINMAWNELKYKAVLKKDYGEIPLTRCYPMQLNQVFMNLLINGAQAIKKQGEISIATWQKNDSIFISISDTGEGIPQDTIKKIFDPFFTTKEIGKGTGLGLSISYEIITKHDGEITVTSEVGKGTQFLIRIPILDGR